MDRGRGNCVPPPGLLEKGAQQRRVVFLPCLKSSQELRAGREERIKERLLPRSLTYFVRGRVGGGPADTARRGFGSVRKTGDRVAGRRRRRRGEARLASSGIRRARSRASREQHKSDGKVCAKEGGAETWKEREGGRKSPSQPPPFNADGQPSPPLGEEASFAGGAGPSLFRRRGGGGRVGNRLRERVGVYCA